MRSLKLRKPKDVLNELREGIEPLPALRANLGRVAARRIAVLKHKGIVSTLPRLQLSLGHSRIYLVDIRSDYRVGNYSLGL
jgi:hypothetical protein